MSRMNITPEVAELMGAYMEGKTLSAQEQEIVNSVMSQPEFNSILSEVSSLPIADDSTFPVGSELLAGEMAMDFMDNHYFSADMHTNSIIGDVTPFPDVMSHDIIQHQSDTCAIKSQQIILHSFGMDIPEEMLVIEATNKGYYISGQGSSASTVGLLLEDHGVGTHSKTNATIYDLMYELAQGHKVIVGVDADELWRPSFFNDLFGEKANHALIVTGIDTSNPFDTRVILTDPGTGDVARSYPVAQFLDAWHDSACFMVATDDAPALSYPNGIYNHEMINFDYSVGHIPSIGNIPYDVFAYTMVPRMDDYFNHQIPDLLTYDDWHNTFDQMHHIYDSFDSIVGNELAEHSSDSWEDIDFDNMFDSLFI